IYNTRSKALIAFQTTEKDAFERVLHGMATRIPPVVAADGPVHENVITGVPDIGHYRFEVVDKQTMTFLALPNHRFGRHLAKARRLGHKTYHAALVIGVDPVMAYT